MDYKEIEALFDRYLADTTTGSNVVDLELRRIVAGLGKSILKLERTSTFLAWVNIGAGGIVIIIGIVQVIVMLRR